MTMQTALFFYFFYFAVIAGQILGWTIREKEEVREQEVFDACLLTAFTKENGNEAN